MGNSPWKFVWQLLPLYLTVLILCFIISISATSSTPLYTYNISCPDGWQKALNNCYLFNLQDELTWSEARTECSLKNADLMVFRTKAELDWISIQTEEYATDGWWLGLHYGASWDWVQYGGVKSLINWRNEPDNYDEQDCCAINEFGTFSDEYCRSQLGFICKYSINRGDLCPSIESSSWFMTDTACYYISNLLNTSLHLTWDQAEQYCKGLLPEKGTELMSITNSDDKRSLEKLLITFSNNALLPWWTGLNDKHLEGEYRWVDNSLANGSLITWDMAPNPDRSKQQNCGVMYQGGSIDDVNCNKRSHYVCEMSAYQVQLNLGCGSWLRGGQSCYFLGQGKGYSWAEAKDMCVRANAHLLQVDSSDERAWVSNLFLGTVGHWTGLTRADNSYGWAWQDKSVASDDLVLWSQEPNDSSGHEDCAEIHRDGLYNDRMCTAKVGYICEYALPYQASCLNGWTKCDNGRCYYASPANDSFAVTWEEAQDRCKDLGSVANLAITRLAVNDKREQTCINNLLQAQPESAPGYWTDLNDIQLEGYWQNQQAINRPTNNDVITWAKEPNNANGNESCAVIYNTGHYNDLNCAAKAFYICEKPSTGVSGTTSAPVVASSAKIQTILLPALNLFIFVRTISYHFSC